MHRLRSTVAFLTGNVMYVLLTGVLGVLGTLTVVAVAASGNPLIAWLLGLTVIVHLGGYWWRATAVDPRPWWAYHLAQLGVVLVLIALGRVLANAPVSLPESALICLAGESLGLWGNTKRGFGLAGGYLGLAGLSVLVFAAPGLMLGALVSLGITAATLVVLITLWNREAAIRDRAEALASELSASRAEIARLTLDAERRRMARELHDTLAQGLTGITLQLEAAAEHLGRGRVQRAGEIIDRSLAAARTTLAASRAAIDDLRRLPDRLDDEIRARATGFTARTGIACRAEIEAGPGLPADEGGEVLRVLDEALSNVAVHAGATGVVVRYEGEPGGGYALEVADDGCGFDPDGVGTGHYGLVGMRERTELLGGRLSVTSRPGRTVVRMEKG